MPPSLPAIIAELRATPSLDRARIEQVTRARLAEQPGNAAFAFYGARASTVGGGRLELDYREPRPGGGATAGRLLNLFVDGVCVRRAQVERAYGPLAVTGAPRGGSPDEELGLSREENWGRLSFGFAERRPDCLRSVSFSYRR